MAHELPEAGTGGRMRRRFVCAALAVSAVSSAWGCTPPPPSEPFGFERHLVTNLPKNARGVMFRPPPGRLRAADFTATSGRQARAVAFRIVQLPGDRVRIEPVQGFRPGMRYRFGYRRAHGQWDYPDRTTVTIDDALAPTGGNYAIVAASHPVPRVILVPTSSGSCVEPVAAVVHEFTYALPPDLERYRDSLDYAPELQAATAVPATGPELVDEWPPSKPVLYDDQGRSLGLGFDDRYNARRNAVVAGCGTQRSRAELSGAIAFPEVDDVRHRVAPVQLDLRRKQGGSCDELTALIATVDWRVPDKSIRDTCRGHLATLPHAQSLRHTKMEDWEYGLTFLSGMGATCNLVALGHLSGAGQPPDPPALHRIGTALAQGIVRAKPDQIAPAFHALGYLVDRLAQGERRMMARPLLAPLQPALVGALSAHPPARPAELAKLLIASGPLPSTLRQALARLASSKGIASAHARSVLAADGR